MMTIIPKEKLRKVFSKLPIIKEITIYLQTADLNILDAKNAIDELKLSLNDSDRPRLIDKFCTDKWKENFDLSLELGSC